MQAAIGHDYSPTPLHYLMFVLQQSSDELLLKEVGIGLSHVRIMGPLDGPAPRSQRAIANATHQTEANVSRQLLVMVRQRLVKVTKNKKDARQRDVTLTAEGKRKYERAQKLLHKQLDLIYKNFSKSERRSWENAFAKIVNSL